MNIWKNWNKLNCKEYLNDTMAEKENEDKTSKY